MRGQNGGRGQAQAVGRGGVCAEVRIDSCCQVVESIPDASGWHRSCAKQRLRPEPHRKNCARHDNAKKQRAPMDWALDWVHGSSFAVVPNSKLLLCNAPGHFERQFPRLAQIELPGPQIRQLFDPQKLIGSRPPKRRQVTFLQFLQALF